MLEFELGLKKAPSVAHAKQEEFLSILVCNNLTWDGEIWYKAAELEGSTMIKAKVFLFSPWLHEASDSSDNDAVNHSLDGIT